MEPLFDKAYSRRCAQGGNCAGCLSEEGGKVVNGFQYGLFSMPQCFLYIDVYGFVVLAVLKDSLTQNRLFFSLLQCYCFCY